MKQIFCLILIFSIKIGLSQNYGAEVIYTVAQNTAFTEKLLDDPESLTKSLVEGLSENLGDVELSLKYSGKQSFYTLKNAPMVNSAGNTMMQEFALRIAYTGDYLRNTESKGVYYRPKSLEDSDIVVLYEDIEWQLFNEKKFIGNFDCYKATGNITTKNSKGTFRKTVVAWYTPEVPAQHGPARYGGLPGLVLQVDDGEMIYTAKSVDFYKSKMMSFPKTFKVKDAKVVSEKEYQDLLIRKLGGLREVFSN